MSRRFRHAPLPSPGETCLLAPDVSHHVLHVTLVPRGTELVLFDGQGLECRARLVGMVDGLAQVEALESPRAVAGAAPVALVVGLPRKPAWERILRMATEMGVASFHPFVAARSVARGEHLQRWERVVESAAQQCGRGDIPRVHGLQKLHAMELPAHRLAMAPGGDAVERPSEATALLIGPEGGLVEGELEGWTRAGLGPTVLRADTAAVAALALYSPTR